MIDRILVPGLQSAEVFEDKAFADKAGPEDGLFPEELRQISRAVGTRRAEYASVRRCARDAMRRLGVGPAPLPKGDRGAPQWPRGIVGSMTHTDGYRAAAVGYAMQFRSVGIDAEADGPLPEGVLSSVSLPGERGRIEAAAACAGSAVHWDRLLFSAKESTYKAWYPLTGRWLGFGDADITCTLDSAPQPDAADADGPVAVGRFRSRILVPGHTDGGAPLDRLDGRWIAAGGLVITAVVVV